LKNDKKTGAGSPICQILQLAIWDLLKLVQKNNPPFAGLVTTILGDIPKKKTLMVTFFWSSICYFEHASLLIARFQVGSS